jgi:CO/xanthine dehydrogenase FAD-binding subunit
VIPASFDYEVAESVDHAIELLGSARDAKLLAGGHSLLPLMRLRLARPELLVDVGRLDELSYVKEDGDALAIGALTRYHDLERSDVLRAQRAASATRRSATAARSAARSRTAIPPRTRPRSSSRSTPSSSSAGRRASGAFR